MSSICISLGSEGELYAFVAGDSLKNAAAPYFRHQWPKIARKAHQHHACLHSAIDAMSVEKDEAIELRSFAER